MKMTNGESSLRMPKEATCDVECAMKVEEIRILSKKRKQSQKVGGGNGVVTSKGAATTGKAAKRLSSNGSGCGAGSHSAKNGGSAPHQGGGAGYSPALGGGVSLSGAGGNSSSSSSSKAAKDAKDAARRRFVWSVPLHQDFVAAVFDVGLKCASPKLLLEMMPVVDGLTSEHIKSHLQKYRLHRQRSREEFLKSYNYLTDLDGGKGLGGGSAAATVAKAAAAAAGGAAGAGAGGSGDAKELFPGLGTGLGTDAEVGGCGSACECLEKPDGGGGGPGNETVSKGGSGGSSGSGGGGGSSRLPDGDGSRNTSAKSTGSPPAPTVGGEGAKRNSNGPEGRAGLGENGAEAVAEAKRLLQRGEGNPVEAANGALLLSHLELLAKGIDMQVKFHNHLREVVESQQQLHAQLAEQRGAAQLAEHAARPTGSHSDTAPRTVPSSTAEMPPPSAVGVSPTTAPQQHAGSGGGSMSGYRTLSGVVETDAVPGTLVWPGVTAGAASGVDKLRGALPAAAAAADREGTGTAAEAQRRIGRSSEPSRERGAGAARPDVAGAAAAGGALGDAARAGARRDVPDHRTKLRGGEMSGERGDVHQ
ncbi:unnamed protein product, partial [Scytosiphon promiscuus]